MIWHYSEDPHLQTFVPHVPASSPDNPPLVWGVDTEYAPLFWFPRDCPRGCIWVGPGTSEADRERFFGQSDVRRIHVIESVWLQRVRDCVLYAYRLPSGPFTKHEVHGYWVTDQTVEAIERVEVGDLLARHAEAGIELRITPSIWPFWKRVAASSLEFSGSRLRNAAPHPDQFD